MKKIRVLQLTSSAVIGGTEKNVLLLARHIDRSQFEIGVASLLDDGPLLDYILELKIPAYRLAMTSLLDWGVLGRLKNVLMDFQPDIIHIYGLRGNLVGRRVALQMKVPKIVCGIRSIDNWRKFYHVWLDQWTAGAVDLFISNSEAGKKAFVEREKFPPEKIIVIHNGIELDKYDYQQDSGKAKVKFGWTGYYPIIGHIANLRRLKGHQMVMDICPELIKQFPNLKIVCLGKDYLNGELQRTVNQRGLDKYIEFLGYRSDVTDYLLSFDISILPSDWEGFPNAILESMAMAKSVIATNVGGIPEIVENGINGILISPKDPQALLKAIIDLASNQEKAKHMGLAGRKIVEENFALNKMISHIHKTYLQLLH